MKFTFTIIALFWGATCALAQSKNTLTVIYGTGISSVDLNNNGFAFEYERARTFGVNYTRNISELFALETGLNFSDNKTRLIAVNVGRAVLNRGSLKLVTVPLMAKLTFFKYIYLGGGINVDIQTNTDDSVGPAQSGLGLQGDLGGKYTFGAITLSVGLMAQRHAIVPFIDEQNNNSLVAGMYKFGVGIVFKLNVTIFKLIKPHRYDRKRYHGRATGSRRRQDKSHIA